MGLASVLATRNHHGVTYRLSHQVIGHVSAFDASIKRGKYCGEAHRLSDYAIGLTLALTTSRKRGNDEVRLTDCRIRKLGWL